ncbi:MAG: HugZ family protein [Granulosicoccus sp.]
MSEKTTPAAVMQALRANMQSVMLSTLGEDGRPHNGYTPFVFDGRDIIIFVSQLSLHTRDLLANGKASAMLIADESSSEQIFARTRASYQCQAVVVPKDHESYDPLLDAMQERHGKMISVLRQLPDFVLFRLQPEKGQFVMGFGQAYHLQGDNLDEFEHATSA